MIRKQKWRAAKCLVRPVKNEARCMIVSLSTYQIEYANLTCFLCWLTALYLDAVTNRSAVLCGGDFILVNCRHVSLICKLFKVLVELKVSSPRHSPYNICEAPSDKNLSSTSSQCLLCWALVYYSRSEELLVFRWVLGSSVPVSRLALLVVNLGGFKS